MNEMFEKSTHFKQVCQLLLSLIVVPKLVSQLVTYWICRSVSHVASQLFSTLLGQSFTQSVTQVALRAWLQGGTREYKRLQGITAG